MKKLLKKYEIKKETLDVIINHPDSDQETINKALAIRRFIVEFIADINSTKFFN